jgi:hypothetical protein
VTKKEHLMADLLAAGIPVISLLGPDDGPSDSISGQYQNGITQDQLLQAQAMINAFDWSDAHHINWILSLARLEQLDVIDRIQNMTLRAIAKLTVDQLNLIRSDVVNEVTVQFDPNNLADAVGQTSPNITVAGAAFGDVVDVSAPYTMAGVLAFGYVSAADTVNVRLQNESGGAVNLANGQWKIVVRRPVARPQITMAQAKAAIVADIMAGSVDA